MFWNQPVTGCLMCNEPKGIFFDGSPLGAWYDVDRAGLSLLNPDKLVGSAPQSDLFCIF